MPFKLLGSLLLTLSGVLLALSLSRYERRQLTVLDGYLALLRDVRGQVMCFASPLADILSGVSPSVLAACLGQPPRRAWTSDPALPLSLPALLEAGRDYLTPESERLLTSFASEFGHTFREEQVSRCDTCIDALSAERQALAAALPNRLRMTVTLCLSLTAASVLVLW